ncbi:hypothetical protein J5751_06540 [bacterium]|nr:hypothetical protein [bacterium]
MFQSHIDIVAFAHNPSVLDIDSAASSTVIAFQAIVQIVEVAETGFSLA